MRSLFLLLLLSSCVAFSQEEVIEEAVQVAQTADSCRAAAEAGDAAAQYELARCYFTGAGVSPSLNKALEWLRKAAEQGYAEAQCNLAECYADGVGVDKNAYEAAVW